MRSSVLCKLLTQKKRNWSFVMGGDLLKKGVFCTNVNFPLINCQISHHRPYFHPLPLSQFF